MSYKGTFSSDGSIDFSFADTSFSITGFKSDGLTQYGFGELVLDDGTEGKMLLVRP